MSSVSIAGDTSGSILLAAPAVAGSSTLTLPTTGGTVISDKTSGTVLQVLSYYYPTTVSQTSQSFADTGLTLAITPRYSTSKILIMVSHGTPLRAGAGDIMYQLQRNGTNIWQFGSDMLYNGGSGNSYGTTATIQYLDSPATTSATTYKTQYANGQPSGTVYAQGAGASITLMEIAG